MDNSLFCFMHIAKSLDLLGKCNTSYFTPSLCNLLPSTLCNNGNDTISLHPPYHICDPCLNPCSFWSGPLLHTSWHNGHYCYKHHERNSGKTSAVSQHTVPISLNVPFQTHTAFRWPCVSLRPRGWVHRRPCLLSHQGCLSSQTVKKVYIDICKLCMECFFFNRNLISFCHKLAGVTCYRADSRFATSQWETALLCNDVSHWLGANLELALL